MRNKKENFSNQNNNTIYKKLEKGEQTNKTDLAKKKLESLNYPINNFFLYIFLVLSICLTTTLYLYYRFNSNNLDELYYVSDVHKLKAYIKSAQFIEEKETNEKKNESKLHDIAGFIELNELFDGISIIGKLSGFIPGSTHAVHIIEFSDLVAIIEEAENTSLSLSETKNIKKRIFPIKNLAEIKLNHYNPLNYKHSCPSTNEDKNYHFGDLGNIIANSDGKAYISIMRKISLKSLNGRLIIISNSPDKCKDGIDSDKLADVIAYGQLNVYKPLRAEKSDGSQEYFLREINAVNKDEFEKSNNFMKSKNKKGRNNSKDIKQNYYEDNKKDMKSKDQSASLDNNFNKDGVSSKEEKNNVLKKLKSIVNPPQIIEMRKTSDNNIENSKHTNNNNSNYFSNTVFNADTFSNNSINKEKQDSNNFEINNSEKILSTNSKELEIPKTTIINNNNSYLSKDQNDSWNKNLFDNSNTLNYNIKANESLPNNLEKNKNKNPDDNDSFIKEFQDLMKDANSQTKSVNISPDSNSRLNDKQIKKNNINEFKPFDDMKIVIEDSDETKEKGNLSLNKSASNTYGKDHKLFANKDDLKAKTNGIYSNKINDPNKTKDKKDLSDEDILNNLLGIRSDLNKSNKKDFSNSSSSSANSKMKKNQNAFFTVPGTDGIVTNSFNNLDSSKQNKNNNYATKGFNDSFFKDLEKETNDLKKSNVSFNDENINFFGKENHKNENNKKNNVGLNKLFEDVVKDEEKAHQKKINEANKNSKDNFNAFDYSLDSGINNNSEKLDKELKRIPISLAQLEIEKDLDTNNIKKKKKIDNNPDQKSKDFSFMSSNLEPLMNNLVTNSTAKGFLNNVDLNLIDPYKISDMDEENESLRDKTENDEKQQKKINFEDNLDDKKSIFSALSIEEDDQNKIQNQFDKKAKIANASIASVTNTKPPGIKGFYLTNFKASAKENKDLLNNPEDIYKIKVDNIENFQDILKNKTLNDLEHLPDKPIDLPLVNQKNNFKSETNKNNSDKLITKDAKNAIINENSLTHKSNNNILKEKNTLLSDVNKKENFRFLNKLTDNNHFDWLKFRQNNLEKDSKDNKKNLNNNFNNDFNTKKNITNNLNENSELKSALENKIKNYYSENKNYLEKINKNITVLDKRVLGLQKETEISNESKGNNDSNKVDKLKDNTSQDIINTQTNKNQNLLTSFIQNVKSNMGTNLKEIANKFLSAQKPEQKINLKELSNSVLSSIKQPIISESKAIEKNTKEKKENEKKLIKNKEINDKTAQKDIDHLKSSKTKSKKLKRPDHYDYNIPNYFKSDLANLDGDEESEQQDDLDEESQQNQDRYKSEIDSNSEDFDDFFSIPKGSIIDSTHKSFYDIGNEISKDSKKLEDEIAEDIKLDLYDEPSSHGNDGYSLKNNKRSRKTQKSGFRSMDKFLEKFGNDKFYTDKIHSVDKNKMFYNHFKNKLPRLDENSLDKY